MNYITNPFKTITKSDFEDLTTKPTTSKFENLIMLHQKLMNGEEISKVGYEILDVLKNPTPYVIIDSAFVKVDGNEIQIGILKIKLGYANSESGLSKFIDSELKDSGFQLIGLHCTGSSVKVTLCRTV